MDGPGRWLGLERSQQLAGYRGSDPRLRGDLSSDQLRDNGGVSYPPSGTIDVEYAEVDSITVEDSYVFEPVNDDTPEDSITLDANASISITNPSATVTFQTGLQLNFPGSSSVTFTGNTTESPNIELLTQQVMYPARTDFDPSRSVARGR